MEKWREEKMRVWREDKLVYGERKLCRIQRKKEEQERPMNRRDEMLGSSKGKGESLYRSEKYQWRGQRMEGAEEWTRKQQMDEQSFSKEENPLTVDEQPQEEEQLDEWLQPSEGDKWPEQWWEVHFWVRRKLEEALDSNEESPSSLMKEREEWLKEEERQFVGKDWPNIAHTPRGCGS
ncbi:hypothetical protein E2562_003929 [Oryza meyeriana var. granulata]|uniref:Uncharacterized protein n=1 Tax=Oryza meyeriana var. granulata TaxID=110450 RepID=A0A6G1D0R3_9ORYZ|nr:hypothetical protein E2562_003929 [Oryza meyeriana var. granulata]